MGSHLDSVPLSGLIRIRDLMFGLENPYRLDQGDVSFEAPDAVKDGVIRANRRESHALRPNEWPPAAARADCRKATDQGGRSSGHRG